MMDIRRRLLKGWLLWMLLCPLLAGCTNDDDVIAIFTGKSWKLTYIAAEGTNKQYDFWGGNETAFQSDHQYAEAEQAGKAGHQTDTEKI